MIWRRLMVPVAVLIGIAALGVLFLNPNPSQDRSGMHKDSWTSERLPVQSDTGTAALEAAAESGTTGAWTESLPINGPGIETALLTSPLERFCELSDLQSPRSRLKTIIAVPAATLWKEPGQYRDKDENIISAEPDIAAWAASMTVREKLWLVGKLETQALLGTEVRVLDERNGWARVAVHDQSTPRFKDGYTGWIPKKQLAEVRLDEAACPHAIVSRPTAKLYSSWTQQSVSKEISFNTKLSILSRQGGMLEVWTPSQTLWLREEDVHFAASLSGQDSEDSILYGRNEKPSGEQLVETANMFLGLPYVWGGTSGFGFDCSGFTYSLYKAYGISIPRDAKDQAKTGKAVPKKLLQPGDLLFYAYEHGRGTVHHVAMYIGDGKMIHSPRSERSVEIIPMSTPTYEAEFAGARRMLP